MPTNPEPRRVEVEPGAAPLDSSPVEVVLGWQLDDAWAGVAQRRRDMSPARRWIKALQLRTAPALVVLTGAGEESDGNG